MEKKDTHVVLCTDWYEATWAREFFEEYLSLNEGIPIEFSGNFTNECANSIDLDHARFIFLDRQFKKYMKDVADYYIELDDFLNFYHLKEGL